jgi:GNAT superfamily N-acetyltransferase
MSSLSSVQDLPPDRADDVVAVLCDAFHDYPVMRYVIGNDDYDARLRELIGLFVSARVLRDEPMIAVSDNNELVAVAIMTPPGQREAPQEFFDRRERVWHMLGSDAEARYDEFGAAWQLVGVTEPNLHLNMIGVRRSHTGAGLGRILLDRVHEMSEDDSASTGVSLTTEDVRNVPLYRYFGYENVGHQNIADGLETWGFFRPNPS